jgi:hypothetical protein
MNGMSIEEMAALLRLKYKTVVQRISRGGYAPTFSGNLYSKDVLEAIRKTSRGRPPKMPEPSKKPKTK